jgi:hypothetical protein
MKVKFKSLVALSAFLVAGCAAFFSVFGLSQLFAGASLAVIIMASSLEIAKIISVSFLQRYWTRISKTLRTYLSIGVFVLVCITSAGIYGFLSNAYQKTATQYEIGENELSALSAKKTLFQKNIDDNKAVLDAKSKRLDQLSSLRTSQEARLNQAASNAERNRVRQDINIASTEIQKLNGEIDVLNGGVKPFIDSVNFYENKMIESKTKNAGASEVGPLKYIATLVGQPMDKVVNWFILLLIFVFDPLAMALVIATNKISGIEKEEKIDEEDKPISSNMDYNTWLANYKKDLWEPSRIEPISVIPEDTSLAVGLTNEESIQKAEETYQQVYNKYHNHETYDHLDDKFEVIEGANESISQVVEEPMFYTGDIPEYHPTGSTISDVIEESEETQLVAPEYIEQIKENIEKPSKQEPVVATGQIKLEDIKEIKAQNRGFSKEIPPPSHNTIQRIGSNKHTKNSEADKIYYKKRK